MWTYALDAIQAAKANASRYDAAKRAQRNRPDSVTNPDNWARLIMDPVDPVRNPNVIDGDANTVPMTEPPPAPADWHVYDPDRGADDPLSQGKINPNDTYQDAQRLNGDSGYRNDTLERKNYQTSIKAKSMYEKYFT